MSGRSVLRSATFAVVSVALLVMLVVVVVLMVDPRTPTTVVAVRTPRTTATTTSAATTQPQTSTVTGVNAGKLCPSNQTGHTVTSDGVQFTCEKNGGNYLVWVKVGAGGTTATTAAPVVTTTTSMLTETLVTTPTCTEVPGETTCYKAGEDCSLRNVNFTGPSSDGPITCLPGGSDGADEGRWTKAST